MPKKTVVTFTRYTTTSILLTEAADLKLTGNMKDWRKGILQISLSISAETLLSILILKHERFCEQIYIV